MREGEIQRESSFKEENPGWEREMENIFCMRERMSDNKYLEIWEREVEKRHRIKARREKQRVSKRRWDKERKWVIQGKKERWKAQSGCKETQGRENERKVLFRNLRNINKGRKENQGKNKEEKREETGEIKGKKNKLKTDIGNKKNTVSTMQTKSHLIKGYQERERET